MASTPSGASSRLLTMKFMQRAAAATTAAPPSSPGVPQQSEDERPSKRVKTEFGGASSSSSPRTPQAQKPLFDHQAAAQAALDAEDEKREALAARLAERLGDAHWRLDPTRLPGSDRRKGVPLNIVQVGFSQIDRSDALATTTRPTEADEPVLQSYQPKQITKKEDDGSDSDTDSDSDSDPDSHSGSNAPGAPVVEAPQQVIIPEQVVVPEQGAVSNTPGRASYGAQKRQELKSRQSAQEEKAKKLAKQRRGKEVKLNNLTSISGAGSPDVGGKGSSSNRRR